MSVSLTVLKYREEIVESVKNNDITIISAETGSGKSTQVCQYLYAEGFDVVVTEPRRLAATSLANRVAEELGEDQVVSYHTGLESNENPMTKILFCTDGLELIRTVMAKGSRNRVLIIDEIHEWNLNQETLLAWMYYLRSNGDNIKLVIMSATIDSDAIADYFGVSCKSINIPGKLYPVTSTYLPKSSLIGTIADEIRSISNVLVFLPGKREISEVEELLIREQLNCEIIQLHGELTTSQQMRAFASYSKPKVILSTNVAQTSVTVPDIDCVVDTGTERRVECECGYEGIFKRPISLSDIKQRAGRAGRTKPGKYYLCSDIPIEKRPVYGSPEIERSILDQVVLRLAAAGIDAREVRFFHQPAEDLLDNAYTSLVCMGAIKGNSITLVGKMIAKYPISARYARMIVESFQYGLVEQTLRIVSMLEIGAPVEKDSSVGTDSLKFKSDLDRMLFYYDVCDSTHFNQFAKNGLNYKRFARIKEFYNKLVDVVSKEHEITFRGDQSNLRKIYLSGMSDRLFIQGWNRYFWNDEQYDLDKNSVCYYRNSYIIAGRPIKIEFKDRWGCKKTLEIVGDCCEITKEDIIEKFPLEVSYIFDEYDSYYVETDETYAVVEGIRFRGILLGKRKQYLTETEHADVIYSNYLKELEIRGHNRYYTSEFLDRKPKEVLVDGVVYTVDKGWNTGEGGCIYLTSEQLLRMSGVTTVKSPYTGNIMFKCDRMQSENLDHLKGRVIASRKKEILKESQAACNEKLTSKISVVESYMEELGRLDVSFCGVPYFLYKGLSVASKKIKLSVFESEEESVDSTREALQLFVALQVTAKYGEKEFRISVDNKRISTKKTQTAFSEFTSFVQEISQEISVENYRDSMEMISEYFQECVSVFRAA